MDKNELIKYLFKITYKKTGIFTAAAFCIFSILLIDYSVIGGILYGIVISLVLNLASSYSLVTSVKRLIDNADYDEAYLVYDIGFRLIARNSILYKRNNDLTMISMFNGHTIESNDLSDVDLTADHIEVDGRKSLLIRLNAKQ